MSIFCLKVQLLTIFAALQRRYNTLSLLDYYLGHGRMQKDDINWNYSDPNVLTMTLPGGLDVTTRVTRRSENDSPPDRLDTSEYFQQVIALSLTISPVDASENLCRAVYCQPEP